jgi:hypothetical protein
MIRISVLYPNEAGKKFDHAYYRTSICRWWPSGSSRSV